MVLSERERKIAIGVGGCLAALIAYSYVISPYFDSLETLKKQTDTAQGIQRRNKQTLVYQRTLKPVWASLSNAMKADDPQGSEAMTQAISAVREWAQAAGVDLASVKIDRTAIENKFVVSGFHVTTTGSMRTVSKLLWALETSPVPMRILDMQITPKQEGKDNLTLILSVSTLSLAAEADKEITTPKPATHSTVSSLDEEMNR